MQINAVVVSLLDAITLRIGDKITAHFFVDVTVLFPNLSVTKSTDKSRHDRMVKLVERMLALHKQLAAAKIEHEKTTLQRQVEATDRQIDALVYELYGLTEEEIKTVEVL